MFIISQYLLKTSGTCKNINQISTYSIITGLVLYASIYLYLLFYNNEYLTIFNKFLIYIIVIDLLLSTFYYFNIHKSFKYSNSIDIDTYKQNQNKEDIESVDQSLESDDYNSDQESHDSTQLQMCDLKNTNDCQEDDDTQEECEEAYDLEKECEQPTIEPELVQLNNEIDELLSIPIPIVVESSKHKKRAPRKKKEVQLK